MPEQITRRAMLLGAGGLAAAPVVGAFVASAPAHAATGEAGAADGALVMVIRHAEKPEGTGAPYGVTASGKRDDESLTITGWTRAGALVELFDPRTTSGPGSLRPGLARPHRIVAARPDGGSARPLETVTPLAARLHSEPDTRWKKGQEKSLAHALDGFTGVTLVAWEHKHITDIARHLGHVSPAAPSSWPGDRFDVVWCFRRSGSGWHFYQVPQLLLAGDRDHGI